MIPFLGREPELHTLKKEYRRGNGFVILYGRRRVGKTTLIKQFIQDKRALYFLASQETETLNLRRFARQVAAFTGQTAWAEASFDDWRPLFQAFADHEPDKQKILVIDELPYLVQGNSALPSILQYAWDEILKDRNVTLILCGSSIGMMRDIALSHASPLYGRRTAQIRLAPLRFSDLEKGFPGASFADLVDLYAVTGGVPKYLEFFDGRDDLFTSIEENVLSTSGFLYEEPHFLLDQEVRDPITYLSILQSVARGCRRMSEISKNLGKQHGELTAYVKALMDLGYIERQTPFNERYPERSKSGLYYISDSFVNFWFHYVQPFTGELELDNMQPSREALDRTFASSFTAFVFERVSREAFADLCAQGRIDFSPSRIGSYWNRRGNLEIDVAALDNTSNRMFLGECKYRRSKPVTKVDFDSLAKKAKELSLPEISDTVLGMFSASGFDDQLLAEARADPRIVLVDQNRIVG